MEIKMEEGNLICELQNGDFTTDDYFVVLHGDSKHPAGTKIGALNAINLVNGKFLIKTINIYCVYV